MNHRGNLKERLKSLRERQDGPHIEPDMQSGQPFKVIEWFDTIRENPSAGNIDKAITYYKQAILDGRYYVVPVGNLQTLVEQLPGLLYFYGSILTDCQQARKILEMKTEQLLAEKKRYFMSDPEAVAKFGNLKITEVNAMAAADPEYQDMEMYARRMADAEHKLTILVDSLENLKYVLHNLVTIRKEGLEEVWVDATKGN
ncbi:MAG: hypothetical protein D6698_04065 [Gammaproteobacteria bacterium]|nr:MAG: hypothetical protein D6698_04065 [Gammaproteobacteria bacterium]